jgi:hypothetical protein
MPSLEGDSHAIGRRLAADIGRLPSQLALCGNRLVKTAEAALTER